MFGILAAFGAARAKDAVLRNVRLAALYLAAAILAVCAAGFFVGALHTYLTGVWGPIIASLALGGVFLILAVIVIVVAKVSAARARRNSATLAAAASAAVPVAAGLASKNMAPKILGVLGALVIGGILGRQIVKKDP